MTDNPICSDTCAPAPGCWWLYMVRTARGHLYTGISTDVTRRLQEHREGKRGARALRGAGPLVLVYCVQLSSKTVALKAEWQIKQLDKAAKEALVDSKPDSESLLACLGLEDVAP